MARSRCPTQNTSDHLLRSRSFHSGSRAYPSLGPSTVHPVVRNHPTSWAAAAGSAPASVQISVTAALRGIRQPRRPAASASPPRIQCFPRRSPAFYASSRAQSHIHDSDIDSDSLRTNSSHAQHHALASRLGVCSILPSSSSSPTSRSDNRYQHQALAGTSHSHKALVMPAARYLPPAPARGNSQEASFFGSGSSSHSQTGPTLVEKSSWITYAPIGSMDQLNTRERVVGG